MKYKQVIKNGLIKKFLENNFEIRSDAALRIFKSCVQPAGDSNLTKKLN